MTGSGVLKGFTDGMAGAGLGALDSAVMFMADPVQSWEAVVEFASSEEARALLGNSVAAAFQSQVDQIGKAVVEGGDANAENLGNQMGQAMALVIQLMVGGGSNSASSALALSRMGIDVSVSTVKKIGASVDIDVLKARIGKLEDVTPDSDVPVIGKELAAGVGAKGPLNTLDGVPDRVQSRVNLANDGMEHLASRHLSGKVNASQFSIGEPELRGLLQSKTVVSTPVTRMVDSADGVRYVREVDVGRSIGTDKFSGGQPTSIMTVMTDKFGNLVTAFPGVLK